MVKLHDYLRDISVQLSGGREDSCEFGHSHHDTMTVSVNFPSQMTVQVFNWMRYETSVPGYCSGKDEISKGIQSDGAWERQESRLVWDFLKTGDNTSSVVLDFGAHIGWYSMLATSLSYETLAIDAGPEHLELLGWNVRGDVVTCRGWIDENKPVIPAKGVRVRLLKVDVEGMENEALRICGDLFAATLVDSVLMEVNPPDYGTSRHLEAFGFKGQPVGDTSGQHQVFFTR